MAQIKQWLVTGGCGFIGTRLIQKLLTDENNRIVVLDNQTVGTFVEFQKSVDAELCSVKGITSSESRCIVVDGDIRDKTILELVVSGADYIVHLAANTGVGPSVEDPWQDCQANVIGTFNVLEAARENQNKFEKKTRVIFASSGAPLGEVDSPPIHESLPANPVSPYGASKLAGEGYCSAYSNSYKVPTVVLRFGNVYGPGSINKGSVIAKFIKHAMNGEKLVVYGDGSQTRDFIFIDDLINAILLSANRDEAIGEKFQIASNVERTVSEIALSLIEVLSEFGITEVAIENTEKRVGDVQRNYSDISKAKKLLGWTPEMDLVEGLQTTVKYFVSENVE